MNRSGKERNAVNTVMIRCWEYIQDFCEVAKKRQEEQKLQAAQSPWRKRFEI